MISGRIDEPTPNGGDYSEIFYLDSNMNPVDESVADKCAIRECKADGSLLSETFGLCNISSAECRREDCPGF